MAADPTLRMRSSLHLAPPPASSGARPLRRGLLFASALLIASCAVDRGGNAAAMDASLAWVQPGATTEAEVRERLGEPFEVLEDGSGRRDLIYEAYEIGRYRHPNDSDVLVFRLHDGTVREVSEREFFPLD